MHRGAYACHPITCWSFPDSEEARGIAARSDDARQIARTRRRAGQERLLRGS